MINLPRRLSFGFYFACQARKPNVPNDPLRGFSRNEGKNELAIGAQLVDEQGFCGTAEGRLQQYPTVTSSRASSSRYTTLPTGPAGAFTLASSRAAANARAESPR